MMMVIIEMMMMVMMIEMMMMVMMIEMMMVVMIERRRRRIMATVPYDCRSLFSSTGWKLVA